MTMKYLGVTTHNLKHIDFFLEQNKITLLKGVSGCGKSSLAIDTVYQISADEMAQLMHSGTGTASYSVDGYSDIIPAICLRQENFNSNPRSTIGTYFNLNQYVQNIFSYVSKRPHTFFQFSNLEVACPECHGLGTVPVPCVHNFLDCFSTLSSKCFRMWSNTDSEFYSVLFTDFCSKNKIPTDRSFNDLTEAQQKKILYGEGNGKKTIRYKCNGKKRSRVGRYRGPMLFLNDLLQSQSLPAAEKKYFNDEICPCCHGSRFSKEISSFMFRKKSIADILLMEFSDLAAFLSDCIRNTDDAFLKQQCSLLLPFISAANAVKLDYLTLNRAIPTLSGGEFQRISLAKASVVQFNGFLYVMDEPISALHPSEYGVVKTLLKTIRDRGNTLLIIEHSNAFDDLADKTVFLGPGAGQNGGNILPAKHQITSRDVAPIFFKEHGSINISHAEHNNVVLENFQIPTGTFVGICGISGSGKSTFIRDILPHYLKKMVYLNQGAIRGNCYSLVATAVNVMNDIEKYFAEKTKKDVKYFWFSSEGPGQCPFCHGTGIISDKSIGWNSEYICPECRGKRFSEKTLSYKIDGLNIYEFLNQGIDAILKIHPKKSAIVKKLSVLSRLGLGYIKPFQNTETLSGGEIQRLKMANAILKYRYSASLVLDEPFRGLDRDSTNKVLEYLYELVQAGCSIYMVEHNPYVLSRCSHLVEFGPGSGKHGGRILFQGKTTAIKGNKKSLISPFLEL